MGKSHLLYSDPQLEIILIERCLVSAWRVPPTVSTIAIVEDHIRRSGEKHPKGIGNINIVTGDTKKKNGISDEAKARMQVMGKDTADIVVAIGYIILARGFIGSIISSYLATMSRIRRDITSTKIFHGADDAATWMAAKLDMDAQFLKTEIEKIIENVFAASP